jgi:enoyl-CoA hydratase/carnithine racemase
MQDFTSIEVSIDQQVATVVILGHDEAAARASATGRRGSRHLEMAQAFEALRADDSVRVVVMTGTGNHFAITATHEQYTAPTRLSIDPTAQWRDFTALVRCHQVMAEMEKPIVARVNGHAVGFGNSMVFASDIIVAREDALLLDHHLGGLLNLSEDGQQKEIGHAFSSVPGDGGAALLPLFMSPVKAKEYLMLAEPHPASELARLGVINYAVPANELDKKVEEIVQRLLSRGAYELAWTKRLVNRRVVDQLNRTLDAGVAYEMVGFLYREKLGGQNKHSLD